MLDVVITDEMLCEAMFFYKCIKCGDHWSICFCVCF